MKRSLVRIQQEPRKSKIMDHLKKDLIQPEVSTPISPDDIMTREKLKEFVDSIKISQTEAFSGVGTL